MQYSTTDDIPSLYSRFSAIGEIAPLILVVKAGDGGNYRFYWTSRAFSLLRIVKGGGIIGIF